MTNVTGCSTGPQPEFSDEDREIFGACGLDLTRIELDAGYLPRKLAGDIDGDGALDEIAQVKRKADGRRGLALCRAGTWLDVLGFGNDSMDQFRPGYIGQTEAWQLISPGGERPRHLQGHALPDADGDIVALERIEKEAVVLYWLNGGIRAQHIYHHVEP